MPGLYFYIESGVPGNFPVMTRATGSRYKIVSGTFTAL